MNMFTGDLLYEFSVNPGDLTITATTLGQAAGYRQDNIPAFFTDESRQVLAELPLYTGLCGGYKITADKQFTPAQDGFYLDKLFFHTGKVIASYLEDCSHLAVFAATAGAGICGKITAANQAGDMMRAYLYDTLGSEIAENVAELVQTGLEQNLLPHGLHITNRYSPGYCGWDVAEQQKLFSLLPPGFCHITLTASSLMVPLKSVSGIIGIGAKAAKKAYGCAICTLEHCYKRRR